MLWLLNNYCVYFFLWDQFHWKRKYNYVAKKGVKPKLHSKRPRSAFGGSGRVWCTVKCSKEMLRSTRSSTYLSYRTWKRLFDWKTPPARSNHIPSRDCHAPYYQNSTPRAWMWGFSHPPYSSSLAHSASYQTTWGLTMKRAFQTG